jgi:hypothetical protein
MHVDDLAVMDESRNRLTKLREKFIEKMNKLRQEQAINILTVRAHKLKAAIEPKNGIGPKRRRQPTQSDTETGEKGSNENVN